MTHAERSDARVRTLGKLADAIQSQALLAQSQAKAAAAGDRKVVQSIGHQRFDNRQTIERLQRDAFWLDVGETAKEMTAAGNAVSERILAGIRTT